jgi:hypothetical protein
MARRWKGSTDPKLQPGYPVRDKGPQGLKITLVYRGPWSALMAHEPSARDVYSALDEGYTAALTETDFDGLMITNVQTHPDGAGTGDLGPATQTIVFEPIDLGESSEVEMAQLERPIETNDYYSLETSDIWAAFNTWEAEPDPTLKGIFKYTIPNTNPPVTGTLTGLIAGLAAKKLKGLTSYIAPAPVLRTTTFHLNAPATANVGKRDTPGFGPTGYEWLKTADRAIFDRADGRWKRTQEWTGAISWDHDIYPAV